ncbi:ABC transporter ATP-binding protein [Paenibacillus sp. 481]|uniref:ABC transporter ATP-binding protein n=1 Tax=Paenibacillus sp. 481 TaxID=2835869 RepID=UPI001E3179EC|nr:ABC transporter ATP-binding protein [Paenibacillus sp. 481]UHA74851.1 ABC transporter ATP-binding protein [Paenibacillus sp. 481]
MSIVQLKQVAKRFDNRYVVENLNLNIEQGEVFGLLGPNGAGKSTTINMLTGLLSLDGGDIVIDNYSIRKDPLKVKGCIGLVPQDLAIFENVSARDNVNFFAKLYGLRGKQLQQQVDKALERVGLTERQHDKPTAFSGGMKRRLNIACAIAHQPKLIIMDEPTVGIDPHSRNHILESVKALNEEGSTIIYTSHYMEEVSAVASRIGIMNEGRLIACGTQEHLRQQVGYDEKLSIETTCVVEVDAPQLIDELKRHPQIKQVIAHDNWLTIELPSGNGSMQDILFILSQHQVHIKTLQREEANLETLFLTLTGRQLRD